MQQNGKSAAAERAMRKFETEKGDAGMAGGFVKKESLNTLFEEFKKYNYIEKLYPKEDSRPAFTPGGF